MEQPFSDDVAKIADGMGVNLYQQFSVAEAALFLRIPISDLETLQRKRKISYIQLTKSMYWSSNIGHILFRIFKLNW
ncbi:hypothetical protein [Catenovulum sediminis]|uniref:hypothetical protein n=1 Tax=Catenovulum sediminis TaxID=1740262 RepID=UPI00117CE9E6|nr:hypothetical protein [Catenovulum sediminis]